MAAGLPSDPGTGNAWTLPARDIAGRWLEDRLGEPGLHTADNIKAAGIAAIETDFTKYTNADGYGPLKKAIAANLLRDSNAAYTADQVVVGTGAKVVVLAAVLACTAGATGSSSRARAMPAGNVLQAAGVATAASFSSEIFPGLTFHDSGDGEGCPRCIPG